MIGAVRLATAILGLLLCASAANAASIVTEWLDEALPAANEVAWEPTIGARFLAILYTATYDAWSAYDPNAVATASTKALKGEGGQANEANKREAISHAAYAVLSALAPHRQHALAERMRALGYDPRAETAPARVGRRAAAAVLAMRAQDGANAQSDFADTSGYTPGAPAAPDGWQPIDYLGKPQLPTTPHWGRVLPFALSRADLFRPPPPPAPGSPEWTSEIETLITVSAALTDEQKAAAEYWAPWGSSPAPHLLELSKYVSNARDLRLDDDAKLFFAVSNAVLDASIATWEAKYHYDYLRPVTAICALGEQPIKAWHRPSLPVAFAYSTPLTRGAAAAPDLPSAAVVEMRAADWQPYLPTPPFPAYVSGHSAMTAAWARVMELATGSPELNLRKTVRHLFVEQRDLTPPVVLEYPTFASAAAASGISRIWGGIHWPVDDSQGRALGDQVGENAWQRAQQFVLGSASPAAAVMASLRQPYWFRDGDAADQVSLTTAQGLEVNPTAGGRARLRSVIVDPLAAGDYAFKMNVSLAGGSPVHVGLGIEAATPSTVAPSDLSETLISLSDSATTVTVPWTSDGVSPFRISIVVRADGEAQGRLHVSAMSATRIWPIMSGSPRYYEMSAAGLAGSSEQPKRN